MRIKRRTIFLLIGGAAVLYFLTRKPSAARVSPFDGVKVTSTPPDTAIQPAPANSLNPGTFPASGTGKALPSNLVQQITDWFKAHPRQ